MCLDQGEPSEGWAVGGGCGKGSRIRAHSGLWNHSEGSGAGMRLLVWALGVGIRQAPASCLSKQIHKRECSLLAATISASCKEQVISLKSFAFY